MRQGEDLGRWVRSVRLGWDQLTTVQQWLCERVLGIEPAGEDEEPKPRRTQADKWAMNYQAAKQFYEREGHLQVPRKHVERTVGEDQEERELKLGAWIGNQRSRAATLSPADGAAVRDRDALGVAALREATAHDARPRTPRHRRRRERRPGHVARRTAGRDFPVSAGGLVLQRCLP
ncbi:helicase associated domain-containing protein [Streptomyces rochei]|uniref:helicase associated domain-containing protein n=1 Tax=Streptomyces rochei TaxID=1928 RepID=UPI0036B9B8E4